MSDPYNERALWIAETIAHLRRQKDLTLKDMAAFAAERGHPLHPDSLSRVETGSRKLSVADLLVIADVLEVPVQQLLHGRVVVVMEAEQGECPSCADPTAPCPLHPVRAT